MGGNAFAMGFKCASKCGLGFGQTAILLEWVAESVLGWQWIRSVLKGRKV